MTLKNEQDKNDEFHSKNFDKLIGFISKFEYTKSQLSIAILIGAMSLWWYTVTNHIPFPIAFTELPATSLLLMLLAIIFFLIIVILLNLLIIPIRQEYKLSKESDLCLAKLFKLHGLKIFIPMFVIPITLAYSLLLIPLFQSYKIIFIPLIVISISISIYKYFWKIYSLIEIGKILIRLSLIFIWVTSIMFIVAIFMIITNVKSESIMHIIVFYLMQIVPLFIYYNLVKLNLKPLSIEQLFKNHIALILTYLTILVLPISTTIVSGSLYLSKLGGGYRTVYTFNDNYANAIPNEYKCRYSQTNRSVPLYVILSIGSYAYVKIINKQNSIPFGIPKDAIIGQYFIPRIEKNEGQNNYNCEYKEK